jgi:hypothetical protein
MAATVVVLLIIYFVTKPRFTTANIDDIIQSIVIGVSLEDVGNIEIYKESGAAPVTMKFAKTGSQWRMPTHFNAKAKTTDIERLIKDVLEMQGKVRATGENYFDQFKVQDQQGVHLLLKDETEKVLVNLIIGKKGEDYGTGFLRFADRDKVFSADKNILTSIKFYGEVDTLTVFNQGTFIDLKAVEFKADELETVALIQGNQELVVKKVSKQVKMEKAAGDTTQTDPGMTTVKEWVIEKAGKEIELDQAEADKFINDIRIVSAAKMVDQIGNTLGDMNKAGKYGLNRSRTGIVYFKEGNQRVQCVFGMEYQKDQGFYFQNGEDGLVYEVSKANYDRYFKWIAELPTKTKK